jgi:glycosyltransferase involved in cell wall biosynthesis
MDTSVIISTFNRLWCLPRAVESCRKAVCGIEVIVVDDGSSDGTWDWLCGQQDIVRIRQQNLGKDWAVNAGFALAKGKYVKFLDSDDTIVAGSIEKQFRLAELHAVDLVVSGYEVVDEQGRILRSANYVETDDFIAQQLGETDGSHYSSFLFRREFISDIPHRQEYGVRDDRMFVLEVAVKKPSIAVLSEPTIRLLHHYNERLQFPKGLKEAATNYSHLLIYKNILKRLADGGELTRRRRKAACKVLWSLAHWIAKTHLDEACELAEWIYQLDPDFQPPENGLLGKLYRRLGFRGTETLLTFRRMLLAPVR